MENKNYIKINSLWQLTFFIFRIYYGNDGIWNTNLKNILDTESNFVIKGNPKDIYLGNHYDEVLNILGPPIDSIKKHSLNINYEMLIFIVDQIEYKLFFKNKILIDVERELWNHL